MEGAPRNGAWRCELTQALMDAEEAPEAFFHLNEALCLSPPYQPAARLLSKLFKAIVIDNVSGQVPPSLVAALSCEGVDYQPIVDGSIRVLKELTPLGEALRVGREQGWPTAAAWLLGEEGRTVLEDGLLRACLARGVNVDTDVERLLTALRRHLLLEAPCNILDEEPLAGFLVALVRQCVTNEFVFGEDDDERTAVEALSVEPERVLKGGPGATQELVLHALYRPLPESFQGMWKKLRYARALPKGLREYLAGELRARDQEAAITAGLESLTALTDEISAKVATQYEENPYPRWLSVDLPPPGTTRALIEPAFDATLLKTQGRPLDVLVAGCGTGRQAILWAHGLGPKERVLAVDISRASIAYGLRMARSLKVPNIRFLQADILDLAGLEQDFDFITSVGVLHHMADPVKGWRVLVDCLRPGGTMHIGLYSAVAHRELPRIKGSDAKSIKAYRRQAMEAEARGEAVPNIVFSRDFFTTSSCRDLLFHVQEHRFAIPEIKKALEALGLEFMGFDLSYPFLRRYREANPDDPRCRDLDRWAAFEEANPTTFNGMYLFHCRKGGEA